ncbi:hypothetical protein FALBO_2732 [Fusarium albosuccineum]|uniref:Secreted protein n=1 Tax=Fusarium albosuccineum TaxID=1237068 RepID=A0A8H4LJM4_9HYPO|nr:hypothetical protein FALBO_2732 [Fusarium albosuccineum]
MSWPTSSPASLYVLMMVMIVLSRDCSGDGGDDDANSVSHSSDISSTWPRGAQPRDPAKDLLWTQPTPASPAYLAMHTLIPSSDICSSPFPFKRQKRTMIDR